MITVTKLDEGFKIESTILDNVVPGDTIEVSMSNTCCGVSDVLDLIEIEEPLFPPTIFYNDDALVIPCIVENINELLIYFYAVPQLDRTINWGTLTITRITNSLDQEITLSSIGLSQGLPQEGTENNGIYNGFIQFDGDSQSVPGTYTFFWTVEDSEGVVSEEGYRIITFTECEEGVMSFVLDPKPTEEEIQGVLSDFFVLGEAYTNVEGVYTVQVKITHDDGSTISEKTCYFNEKDLACRVAQAALDDCTSDVHFDYFVLKSMHNCSCDCQNMCLLFQRIIKKLNEEFCCDDVTSQPCHQC
jgi:hypothetical protein